MMCYYHRWAQNCQEWMLLDGCHICLKSLYRFRPKKIAAACATLHFNWEVWLLLWHGSHSADRDQEVVIYLILKSCTTEGGDERAMNYLGVGWTTKFTWHRIFLSYEKCPESIRIPSKWLGIAGCCGKSGNSDLRYQASRFVLARWESIIWREFCLSFGSFEFWSLP